MIRIGNLDSGHLIDTLLNNLATPSEPVDILSEPDSMTEVMGLEPVDQELWVEPVDMVSEPVDMMLEPVDMVVL